MQVPGPSIAYLYVYDRQPGLLWGYNEDLMGVPRSRNCITGGCQQRKVKGKGRLWRIQVVRAATPGSNALGRRHTERFAEMDDVPISRVCSDIARSVSDADLL